MDFLYVVRGYGYDFSGWQQMVFSISLAKFANSTWFFWRHKVFGKSWLDIWISEVCLPFILRLESFCDKIGKYPLVIGQEIRVNAKIFTTCYTAPSMHWFCQCVNILSVAQACESSLSSSMCDILYKLPDERNDMPTNYLPAIVHMLMRCNNMQYNDGAQIPLLSSRWCFSHAFPMSIHTFVKGEG